MKKKLGRIIGIIFILILGYQQFCYADVVIPDYLFKNKNTIATEQNNTIVPKPIDIEKDNNILPSFFIAGGLVIIAVCTSIIILNKSKNKDIDLNDNNNK